MGQYFVIFWILCCSANGSLPRVLSAGVYRYTAVINVSKFVQESWNCINVPGEYAGTFASVVLKVPHQLTSFRGSERLWSYAAFSFLCRGDLGLSSISCSWPWRFPLSPERSKSQRRTNSSDGREDWSGGTVMISEQS